ncbi:MAG: DUF3105 domain-containing protein, partial [Dehalococcoidia bacterium]
GDLKGPTPTKTFWQKYQWYIIVGIAFFFVITVIVPALSSAPAEDDSQPTGQTDGTSGTSVSGELNFPSQGREHIPMDKRARSYNSNPPTSGEHWSVPGVAPAAWGIYDQILPDEIIVHNLEHGGVVIHYLPTVAPSTVAQLKEFIQQQLDYPTGYILAPRSNLPASITISAWEYYLPLFQINEQLMKSFISAHYDQAPEGLAGGP